MLLEINANFEIQSLRQLTCQAAGDRFDITSQNKLSPAGIVQGVGIEWGENNNMCHTDQKKNLQDLETQLDHIFS